MIAGVVVALLALGGVGIFAVKQTLFQVHSDVTDATQDGMLELTRGESVRVRPPTAMVLTAEQAAMFGKQIDVIPNGGVGVPNPLASQDANALGLVVGNHAIDVIDEVPKAVESAEAMTPTQVGEAYEDGV